MRRLTPSPFSMEAVKETEQTANTEDGQGEHYALHSVCSLSPHSCFFYAYVFSSETVTDLCVSVTESI